MKVLSGLEVLLAQHQELIAGKTIGLIINPTSVNRELASSVELLNDAAGCRVGALFGPEHGYDGRAQDMVSVDPLTDSRLGVPIHSLYGRSLETLKPRPEQFASLEALLFDIQDIGVRYYTFSYTMAFCMEAAAEADLPFIVLDRPNPLSGAVLEGNVGDINFRSFVGYYPLPARHGMTVGELARYFNEEFGINCNLTIVHMEHWRRRMWYDETGLPWIGPSPNMPLLETATVYAGSCLLEGTNVSEGRGTCRPFETLGAPYIEPHQLAEALNRQGLEGVRFRPIYFTPTFHKYAGQVCGGVFIHVRDRNRFRPFLAGLALIMQIRKLYPADFKWRTEPYEFDTRHLAFDLLCGTDKVRKMIEAGEPLAAIRDFWKVDAAGFQELREHYLIYRDL